MDKDISNDCTWRFPDDELLPLTRCPCGRTWGAWEFNISIYREDAVKCQCGRRLYFTQTITVWEVVDGRHSEGEQDLESEDSTVDDEILAKQRLGSVLPGGAG